MLPSVGCDARLRFVPVRMVGFEPTLSGTPSRRIARLSHILIRAAQVARAVFTPPTLWAAEAEGDRASCMNYTGIDQRRRQGSNLRPVGLQPTAGAVRSDVVNGPQGAGRRVSDGLSVSGGNLPSLSCDP